MKRKHGSMVISGDSVDGPSTTSTIAGKKFRTSLSDSQTVIVSTDSAPGSTAQSSAAVSSTIQLASNSVWPQLGLPSFAPQPPIELPVALVFAGFNRADHAISFAQLASHLTDAQSAGTPSQSISPQPQQQQSPSHAPPIVVSIRAKECSSPDSALRMIVHRFLVQLGAAESGTAGGRLRKFTRARETLHDVLKRAHDEANAAAGLKQKHKTVDMDFPLEALKESYDDLLSALPAAVADGSSTLKHGQNVVSDMRRLPKLVIMFEDFETFDSRILSDVLYDLATAAHPTALPLLCVFGLATSARAVHTLLPLRITSRLQLRQFRLQSSGHIVNRLFERLLMGGGALSCGGLQLGANTLDFLWHHYSWTNRSVKGFTRGLRYALLDHFDTQPFAYLAVQRLGGSRVNHNETNGQQSQGSAAAPAASTTSSSRRKQQQGRGSGSRKRPLRAAASLSSSSESEAQSDSSESHGHDDDDGVGDQSSAAEVDGGGTATRRRLVRTADREIARAGTGMVIDEQQELHADHLLQTRAAASLLEDDDSLFLDRPENAAYRSLRNEFDIPRPLSSAEVKYIRTLPSVRSVGVRYAHDDCTMMQTEYVLVCEVGGRSSRQTKLTIRVQF